MVMLLVKKMTMTMMTTCHTSFSSLASCHELFDKSEFCACALDSILIRVLSIERAQVDVVASYSE